MFKKYIWTRCLNQGADLSLYKERPKLWKRFAFKKKHLLNLILNLSLNA